MYAGVASPYLPPAGCRSDTFSACRRLMKDSRISTVALFWLRKSHLVIKHRPKMWGAHNGPLWSKVRLLKGIIQFSIQCGQSHPIPVLSMCRVMDSPAFHPGEHPGRGSHKRRGRWKSKKWNWDIRNWKMSSPWLYILILSRPWYLLKKCYSLDARDRPHTWFCKWRRTMHSISVKCAPETGTKLTSKSSLR